MSRRRKPLRQRLDGRRFRRNGRRHRRKGRRLRTLRRGGLLQPRERGDVRLDVRELAGLRIGDLDGMQLLAVEARSSSSASWPSWRSKISFELGIVVRLMGDDSCGTLGVERRRLRRAYSASKLQA